MSKLLQSISDYWLNQYELLIIDSSSTDKTLEIAKEYTDNIILIPQREFDHGGTRTKALQMASGDIIVYLTQDALPYDKYALENIIKVFEDDNIAAAYGRQLSYPDTNLFGKHLRAFNYGEISYVRSIADKDRFGIKTAFLSDSFAAYRRSALQEIGYFKDGLILGEDTYAGARLLLAGYKLAYVADAQVYHSHSYTLFQEFKRYFDIGVFHQSENWILKVFGQAEGEGIKYLQSEIKFLFNNDGWLLIPEFFIRNGMKYIGYKLGQRYEKLPVWMVKKISMHHTWWEKNNNITRPKKEKNYAI